MSWLVDQRFPNCTYPWKVCAQWKCVSVKTFEIWRSKRFIYTNNTITILCNITIPRYTNGYTDDRLQSQKMLRKIIRRSTILYYIGNCGRRYVSKYVDHCKMSMIQICILYYSFLFFYIFVYTVKIKYFESNEKKNKCNFKIHEFVLKLVNL